MLSPGLLNSKKSCNRLVLDLYYSYDGSAEHFLTSRRDEKRERVPAFQGVRVDAGSNPDRGTAELR